MSIEQETYVTAGEIAQALRVKISTVYGWVRRKQLPCVKIGPRLVRFRRSDLKRLTRHDEQLVDAEVSKTSPPEQDGCIVTENEKAGFTTRGPRSNQRQKVPERKMNEQPPTIKPTR